jgi:hypothetical protein
MFEVTSFDKFRARVIEHKVYDIQKSNDDTEITFTLGNGEVYQIYTKEVEVQYARENDWVFVQSEMVIAQTVEP